MASPYSCILWDFDGTVLDGSEGILRRLSMTLAATGRAPLTHADAVHWIGPPLHESFQRNVGMTEAEATAAVDAYRDLAKVEGVAAGAQLFPGVADVLAAVAAAGIPQSTASSKPEYQIVELVQHFHLERFFAETVGASPDERTLARKPDIVAEALRRLAADGVDTSSPVLIGDRHHDVEGGIENGLPVIFVSWGFGEPREAEGAIAVVDDAAQLAQLLLPVTPGPAG